MCTTHAVLCIGRSNIFRYDYSIQNKRMKLFVFTKDWALAYIREVQHNKKKRKKNSRMIYDESQEPTESFTVLK